LPGRVAQLFHNEALPFERLPDLRDVVIDAAEPWPAVVVTADTDQQSIAALIELYILFFPLTVLHTHAHATPLLQSINVEAHHQRRQGAKDACPRLASVGRRLNGWIDRPWPRG